MYRFVDLTEDEKHLRRERLDRYGQLAQLSVLVPLLVIQIFFLASWLKRKFSRQDGLEQAPSSLYAKQIHVKQSFGVKDVARRWRTFLWWCGDSVWLAGFPFGTNGEVLGGAVWMLWLLTLSFLQTGDGKSELFYTLSLPLSYNELG